MKKFVFEILIFKQFILFYIFFTCGQVSAQTLTISYDGNGNRSIKNNNSNIPVASISGDTVACIGNIIRLEASGGDSYQWIDGPNQRSYSTVINANKTFRVIVTKGPGCKDTATYTVKGVPAPVVKPIIGDSAVTVNYITNYTTPYSYGAQYIWSVTNGLILSGQNTNTISVKWNSTPSQGIVNVTALVNSICYSDMKPKNVNIGLQTKLTKTKIGSLNIYPNPSRDYVFVHLTLNELLPIHINIVNMLGETIFSKQFDNIFEINLPLNRSIFGSSGVFNVIAKSPNTISTQKVIITD